MPHEQPMPRSEADWDRIWEAVKRPRTWTGDEIDRHANDPSHLSDEQLYSYLDGTLDEAARAAVEAHAVACDFCLHQLAELGSLAALDWRAECPGLLTLVLYLANLCPDEAALRMHLEEDQCQCCRRVLELPWLSRLAEALRAGQRTLDSVRGLVDAAVIAVSPLAQGGVFATELQGPSFQARGVSKDKRLTATMYKDSAANLAVYVETPDLALAELTVHVEIRGDDVLEADVRLGPWDSRGCDGRHSFGPFEKCRVKLGPHPLLLARPTDDPPWALPNGVTGKDQSQVGR